MTLFVIVSLKQIFIEIQSRCIALFSAWQNSMLKTRMPD